MNGKYKNLTIIATLVVIGAIILAYMTTIPRNVVTPTPTPTPTPQFTLLQGAGASFVFPQVNEWAQLFYAKKGIRVNYQSVGSGAGLSMFFQGTVDFACSDPPLSKDVWEKNKGEIIQIPWLIGGVVVIYNIPEVPVNTTIRLDEIALAKIYKGEIAYWDDSYIKNLNPGIAGALPHKEIIAVYRSDSSGTTEIFTTYLNKATNNMWPKELVGKTVNWPVIALGRGIGGKGNEGVTQIVKQTPYSIGYVEWGYAIANNLPTALLKNAAGAFVEASRETLMSALENVNIPSSPLDDFSHVVYEAVYAPGAKSYPISALTHLILWRRYDQARALTIKEFLRWILDEGYNNTIPGYVPPPQSIRMLLNNAINIIETA
ncbi:MAG: phosphate ABC transporter substrate-binding protein PstS [Desulfurococcaceae archaeon]